MMQRPYARRRVRTSQPTHVVGIARSASAFAERCIFAYMPSVGPINLATDKLASTIVPGAANYQTRYGTSSAGTGTQNERLEFPGAPTTTDHPITFLCLFRTFNGNNGVSLLASSTTNGAWLGHDGSHQYRISGLYLSSPAYLTDAQDDATFEVIAASYNPATGVALGAIKNLSTGAVRTASGSGGGAYTAGNGTWVVNPGGGTTKVPNRVLVAASQYAESPAGLLRLLDQPWHFLAEDLPRRRVFLSGDAGGGGGGGGSHVAKIVQQMMGA